MVERDLRQGGNEKGRAKGVTSRRSSVVRGGRAYDRAGRCGALQGLLESGEAQTEATDGWVSRPKAARRATFSRPGLPGQPRRAAAPMTAGPAKFHFFLRVAAAAGLLGRRPPAPPADLRALTLPPKPAARTRCFSPLLPCVTERLVRLPPLQQASQHQARLLRFDTLPCTPTYLTHPTQLLLFQAFFGACIPSPNPSLPRSLPQSPSPRLFLSRYDDQAHPQGLADRGAQALVASAQGVNRQGQQPA